MVIIKDIYNIHDISGMRSLGEGWETRLLLFFEDTILLA